MVQFILGLYLGMNIMITIIHIREPIVEKEIPMIGDIIILLFAGSLIYLTN